MIDGVDHSIGGVDVDTGRSASITTNYGEPNANTVILEWRTSHAHGGVDWTYVFSNSVTRFTADQNSLTYAIDGAWKIDGVAGPPTIAQRTYLVDLTAGSGLFDSYQVSRYSLNVDLAVDGGGDHVSIASGSLTGSLVLGHEYEWYFNTYIPRSLEGNEGGAVGSGFRTLTIASDVSAVPEPLSLTLFGLGGLGLAVAQRRRTRENS